MPPFNEPKPFITTDDKEGLLGLPKKENHWSAQFANRETDMEPTATAIAIATPPLQQALAPTKP